jgi:hypothetical protein
MKVKELIEHLQTIDPEAEVLVADYYYSDLESWQDVVVEDVQRMFVYHNGYVYCDTRYVDTDEDNVPYRTRS